MTMRYCYGIRNVSYYPGPAPEGYARYFRSRGDRDRGLGELRARAIAGGLAVSAASAGIYAIRRYVASATGEAWLREALPRMYEGDVDHEGEIAREVRP